MADDSHELGGRRSQARHAFENGGISGLLFVVLSRIESLDSVEKTALMAFGITAGGAIAKAWNEHRLTGKLLAKIGLGGIVLTLFTGCAWSVGDVQPMSFEGRNGETIIACRVQGIQVAVGDGGLCRNAEGGHVSQVFSGLFTGTVEAAGRIVGALLSPFGALGAAGDALRAPAAVPVSPPPPAPPLFVD